MGVSIFSVVISIAFYNLSLIAVFFLRRTGIIRAKYAPSVLMFLTALGLVRLLTPFDLKQAHIIRSYKVLPFLWRGLTTPVLGSLSLGSILLIIWAAGTVCFLLRDVVRQRRFVLADKMLPLSEDEQISRIAAEFGDQFKLRISLEVEIPYVTGLFKPVIYVPDIELSDEEWRNIFRHETQHVRAHDEWKKLLFRGVRAIFWWNPLAHLSEKDISLLIELQCDASVAGDGSPDEQEAYLRTMLELMKRHVRVSAPVSASRMIGKQSEMKLRFEALPARDTRLSKWIRTVLSVLMVALFTASYFVIVQPAFFPTEEQLLSNPEGFQAYDVSDELLGPDDIFVLYVDGEYKLYINGEYAYTLSEDEVTMPPFDELPMIGGK